MENYLETYLLGDFAQSTAKRAHGLYDFGEGEWCGDGLVLLYVHRGELAY